MYVLIDNDTAISLLMDRVEFWTDDRDVLELFEIYYTNMVEDGCLDGAEFDVMRIVDNDYINWFSVFSDEGLEEEDWITDDRIYAKYNGYNLVYVG